MRLLLYFLDNFATGLSLRVSSGISGGLTTFLARNWYPGYYGSSGYLNSGIRNKSERRGYFGTSSDKRELGEACRGVTSLPSIPVLGPCPILCTLIRCREADLVPVRYSFGSVTTILQLFTFTVNNHPCPELAVTQRSGTPGY